MKPVIIMNVFILLQLLTLFIISVSGKDNNENNDTGAPQQQHLLRHRRLFTVDGTLTLGESAGPFTLSPFSSLDTAGTTQIYQLSPNPMPWNTRVNCEITSCTKNFMTSFDTTNIWIKKGSMFDSNAGDVGGPCGPCSDTFVCSFDLIADCSEDQTFYAMVYTDSRGGTLEDVVIKCYDAEDCGNSRISIASNLWSQPWQWLQGIIP